MNVRKVRKVIFLIIIFILIGFTVLKVVGEKNTDNKVTLYFFNTDMSALVPKEQKVTADGDELYEEIAKALIKGPSKKKYSAIMEKDVKLLDIKKDGRKLTVDFSEEYKTASGLTTYAVIKTYCALAEIDSVLVRSGGADVLGDGFVSGDAINLESDDDCATTVSLYFADEDKSSLVREYRKINITDTRPVEEYILAELIKGPKDKKNIGLLSENTGVTSVEVTDGTCYVNFKRGFESENSASKEVQRLLIYSVVNSMTGRDGVKNVQFLIDGKKADKFGDLDISTPLFRNENLIK